MSRKILIVEDDAATAGYLAKGLGEAGYSVQQCRDGRDGLFLASEGIFDLIIADRMLPGLDGLALLDRLRAGGVKAPVLVLSALSSVDERIRGLRAGGDDYLAKPFSAAELRARVEVLARRPAEREASCCASRTCRSTSSAARRGAASARSTSTPASSSSWSSWCATPATS